MEYLNGWKEHFNDDFSRHDEQYVGIFISDYFFKGELEFVRSLQGLKVDK